MLSKGQAVVKQNCSKEAFPGKYFLGINAASHERGIKAPFCYFLMQFGGLCLGHFCRNRSTGVFLQMLIFL